MNPLDWLLKLVELGGRHVFRFVGSPQMEVQGYCLGWSDRGKQQLAVLLWVKFTNTKERPFLVRSLELQHRSVNYKAIAKQGHVSILGPTGWRVKTLHARDCVVMSPQIPAMDIANRHGFFPLPKELSMATGPFLFEVTATFQGGRSRRDEFGVDGLSTHVPIARKPTRPVRYRFRSR